MGITSRRKAEQLIGSGCVSVNGNVVTQLGSKADLSRDKIRVNGKLLKKPEPRVYILLNKPKGYITSLKDPEGRATVMDLIRGVRGRVYPVGRLDYDTEGVLVLTNDGEFAHQLMHPRHRITKTYRVKVKGQLSEKALHALSTGIQMGGDKVKPVHLKKRGLTDKNSWIEIALNEGKNRQIKRMMEKVGYGVLKLKRISYGHLDLKGLPVGAYRFLTQGEVARFRRAGRSGR